MKKSKFTEKPIALALYEVLRVRDPAKASPPRSSDVADAPGSL